MVTPERENPAISGASQSPLSDSNRRPIPDHARSDRPAPAGEMGHLQGVHAQDRLGRMWDLPGHRWRFRRCWDAHGTRVALGPAMAAGAERWIPELAIAARPPHGAPETAPGASPWPSSIASIGALRVYVAAAAPVRRKRQRAEWLRRDGKFRPPASSGRSALVSASLGRTRPVRVVTTVPPREAARRNVIADQGRLSAICS